MHPNPGPPRPIAACRPVDLSTLPELPPGLPVPPVYPGSIIQPCERCRQDIYVGPKAQEAAEHGPIEIMCFMCAIDVTAAEPGITPLTNFGNTYLPEKGTPRRGRTG